MSRFDDKEFRLKLVAVIAGCNRPDNFGRTQFQDMIYALDEIETLAYQSSDFLDRNIDKFQRYIAILNSDNPPAAG